jgi:rod shape determining protein RodA
MRKLDIFKRLDWLIIGCVGLISIVGLMILYSASIKANGTLAAIDASKQLAYFGLGIVLLFAFSAVDYRMLKNYSLVLYIVMLLMLLAVEFFGKSSLGATRWINIGFFQLQPSEFAKLILTIVLAKFFAKNYDQSNELKYLLISLIYLLIPAVMVMAQPDLGTALVLVVIWLSMVFITKINKLYIVGGFLGLGALLPLVIPRLKPYQRHRLYALVNPAADPLGTGYNVNQSMITVGSGRIFGQGLSSGSQSQLNFLPSQNTDFVFAVLAEKLGFVGAVLAIGLYCLLFVRMVLVAQKSSDRFGMFLVVGIVAMMIFHFVINIGMNLGIMPVTGIPLPFISAGGSVMIVSMVSIGIVQSVFVRRRKVSSSLFDEKN